MDDNRRERSDVRYHGAGIQEWHGRYRYGVFTVPYGTDCLWREYGQGILSRHVVTGSITHGGRKGGMGTGTVVDA